MSETDSYDISYLATFRERLFEQLGAYRELREGTDADGATSAEWETFDPYYFRTMVLALDRAFVDRSRRIEDQGENLTPLQELRLLSAAILDHDGVLTADPTIAYDPETSTTGLEVGSPVVLDQGSFARLAEGVLAEIEARCT